MTGCPAYMRFIPNMSKFDGTLSRSSWIILSVKENKIVPLLGNKQTVFGNLVWSLRRIRGSSLDTKLTPVGLLLPGVRAPVWSAVPACRQPAFSQSFLSWKPAEGGLTAPEASRSFTHTHTLIFILLSWLRTNIPVFSEHLAPESLLVIDRTSYFYLASDSKPAILIWFTASSIFLQWGHFCEHSVCQLCNPSISCPLCTYTHITTFLFALFAQVTFPQTKVWFC